MKRLLIAAVLASAFALPAQAQQSKGPLTNESVVKLVKAGFKEKTVITIISSHRSAFKLDPEQLIELKREGVSEKIILAMLSAQDATFVFSDEDAMSDDAFLKQTRKSADNTGADTDVFGSGGGSKSQNETPGGGGSKQNDGSSTGSATVKIMRPPVQAGATPQLEKTATLNNEGVIRLVEAGFSEGTIIKRIEGSPVDFDFSPAGLEALYKGRVTDAIIAVMRTAMGTESRPK